MISSVKFEKFFLELMFTYTVYVNIFAIEIFLFFENFFILLYYIIKILFIYYIYYNNRYQIKGG